MAQVDEKDEKQPDGARVLILGGCGFIGRHMVQYLLANKCASVIYVADKQLPQTSYFSAPMLKVFEDEKVKRIQCDLSKDAGVSKAFENPVDYVINLCGETAFGKSDNEYKTKCLDTAVKCANEAIKKGLTKWIEVSTAQVYEPKKEPPNKENDKIEPFTKLAQWRYKAEEELSKLKLPMVILRPAMIYGPGDKTSIMPRLVCAACYKHAKKEMKFLWSKGVRINVVHVRDVCQAIWTCCVDAKVGKIYNLADKSDLTQGDFNVLVTKIFNIKTGFQNAALNKTAKAFMQQAAQASNDQHMPMWSDLCKVYKIEGTPLTPYIDEEILTKNHLAVDGTLIEKDLKSFHYKYPKVVVELLQEIIQEYVAQQYFPDFS